MTSITGIYGDNDITINGLSPTDSDIAYIQSEIDDLIIQLDDKASLTLNNTFSGINIFNNDVSSIITTVPSIVIPNYNFATPVVGLNSSVTQTTPYANITGWTKTIPVGVPANMTIAISNGFTSYCNTFPAQWPFTGVNQYLTHYTANICSFQVSQVLTIVTTGFYNITCYAFGQYNNYASDHKLSISCGSYSLNNLVTSEQSWTRFVLRAYLTAGSNTVAFTLARTVSGAASGLSITNILVEEQYGFDTNDGTTIDNQNINPNGLITTDIYNRGQLWQQGSFNLTGPLNINAPSSPGSVVIGNCPYGTNSTDEGVKNVFIGSGNVVNAYSNATNISYDIGIGYGSLEQTRYNIRNIGIGFNALRYLSQAIHSDNICLGNAGSAGLLGYNVGTSSCQRNIVIGNGTAGSSAVFNDQIVIGYQANNVTDFSSSNNRSQSVIIGNYAGANISAQNNTVIGHQCFQNSVNVNSSLNTIIGSQAGNNQAGANIMTKCLLLGSASNVNVAGAYSNSTAIGYGTIITTSNQLVLGGNDGAGVFPTIRIPNKFDFLTTQSYGAVATINLAFNTGDTVLITSTTTTAIVLPASTSINVGARFQLYKTYTSTNIISIVAPASCNIIGNATAAASYSFGENETYLIVSCIAGGTGNTWVAESKGLYLSANSNATITGTYTFSTNPVFNNNAIPTAKVEDIVTRNSTYNNTFVGQNSGNTSGVVLNSTYLGNTTGQITTTGDIDECTLLGKSTDFATAAGSYRNSTAIGAYSQIFNDNEIVLGGLNQFDGVTYPQVVMPAKLKLQSSQLYNSSVYSVAFGRQQAETILLETATVATINLPIIYTTNLGFTITITRAYIPLPTDTIMIYTSGENIQSADVGPSASFTMDASITSIRLTVVQTSVSIINWVASYSRQFSAISDGTNVAYPVAFSPLSDGNINQIYTDASITYNPSSNTLTATNFTGASFSGTSVTTTRAIYLRQAPIIQVTTTANITYTIPTPLYNTYQFSNMSAFIVTYNLPTVTSVIAGWTFRVKRLYGSNLNVCTFNPSSVSPQPIVFDSVGAPSTGAFNMSTAQSMFEFQAIQTQLAGITGTFTNTAGATQITINSVSGNILFLGGTITLAGNVNATRIITSYITGRGGTGTYGINTAITLANTAQNYTSVASYGYMLTSFN